jgi:hypothetical protein
VANWPSEELADSGLSREHHLGTNATDVAEEPARGALRIFVGAVEEDERAQARQRPAEYLSLLRRR